MTLFLFKIILLWHVHNTGKYRFLSFDTFINEIKNSWKIEKKKIAVNNQNKCERFRKKWLRIENEVP